MLSACASQDGTLAAWLSEDGELCVYSFGYQRLLLRYRSDGAAPEPPGAAIAHFGAKR